VSATNRVDAVCLGILVADVVARPVDGLPEPGTLQLVDEIVVRGGGGAHNVSIRLARWGLAVEAVGKVGADSFGDFVVSSLRDRNVGCGGVLRDGNASTSASVVLVDADGERSFLHVVGANGALRADELDVDAVCAGRWLLLTGALVLPALDGAPAAALLAEAKRRGGATALDTVWDPTGGWSRVAPLLPHVDVFMPSLAEAREITGERDCEAVAAALHAAGVREVALKLGAAGCYASGEGFTGRIEPIRVRTVEETGAGDAFVAGVLYGKLAGWSFERCVRFGNAAGAVATTTVGAAEGVVPVEETAALAGL
jgi:sugar/nucleoside kinase (ribokinase family)